MFWATVQVGGVAVLAHVIDDASDDATVQVDAVVRSISAGGGVGLVACAKRSWITLPLLAVAVQVRGVEPLEQEVELPNVPSHTSKPVMLPK